MNIIPEPNIITPRKGAFILSKNCDISENPSKIVDEKILGTEGYILNIQQNSIYISAQKENGLFYGIQTLKQLIAEYTNNGSCKIPAIEIRDTPRFKYFMHAWDKKSLVDGIKANKEVKKAAKIHASK